MTSNSSKPAGCKKTCIHPNNRVSFVFVENYKNFMDSKSYCEDLNGTLAENLNLNALKTIQTCCNSNYNFRIGLIQDEVCASNSAHLFRWLSANNRCIRAKKFNITNKALFRNSSCKTASIVRTPSQISVPQVTLHDCNKAQPFICQKIFDPSHSKILPTETTTMTSTSTSTFAYNESNTTARMTFYPALTGGVTLGFAVLLSLLVFLACRRCKKSNNQNIPFKISSKGGSIKEDPVNNSQDIRFVKLLF